MCEIVEPQLKGSSAAVSKVACLGTLDHKFATSSHQTSMMIIVL